jgi:hypothetical protein
MERRRMARSRIRLARNSPDSRHDLQWLAAIGWFGVLEAIMHNHAMLCGCRPAGLVRPRTLLQPLLPA